MNLKVVNLGTFVDSKDLFSFKNKKFQSISLSLDVLYECKNFIVLFCSGSCLT